MPELGSSGSVRGALRNERPYRERYTPPCIERSSGMAPLLPSQSSADYIMNTCGYDFRCARKSPGKEKENVI